MQHTRTRRAATLLKSPAMMSNGTEIGSQPNPAIQWRKRREVPGEANSRSAGTAVALSIVGCRYGVRARIQSVSFTPDAAALHRFDD